MIKMDVGAIVLEPGARVLCFPSRGDDADFRTKKTFRPHVTYLELPHLDPLITPKCLSKSFCYPYLLHGAVIFDKLIGSQLVKKFPAFYRIRKFITAFTSSRHLPLS